MTSQPLTSGLLVVFGITGDLSRRYLLPALYHLAKDELLPEHFEIIGVTRRGTTIDILLDGITTEITKQEGECDKSVLDRLEAMMRIVKMDMTLESDYSVLKTSLDAIEDEHGVCLNRLFYLSIPPQIFGPVVDMLGSSGLNDGCQHGEADSRIMIEKPFGYDLSSAQELIKRITHSFKESQIYRIDHYLAKETAQNILTFRLSNPVFGAVWNHNLVDSITIEASESIGIEGRVAFYEPTGALRDIVQNHLLQLLSIVTMELPAQISAAHIHDEKLKLLESIQAIRADNVATETVRGQYLGYRDEVGSPQSITETFAQVHLAIDNDRWRDVPIVLRTGKKLDHKTTEVTVVFSEQGGTNGNTLVFRLQPNEGIALDLQAKKPGFDNQTQQVEMAFNYPRGNGSGIHPNAYERVLMDGIKGDQTLFATSNEVLESWRIVDAVVAEWAKNDDGLIIYEPGSTPEAVNELA